MDEQPTPQEGAEPALDEAGQPDPVGALGGCGEEGTLSLFADVPIAAGEPCAAGDILLQGDISGRQRQER
jgi:hypothetical protein